MNELWIASDNAKKRAELERLLAPLGYRLRTLAEAPRPVEIVEDAPDFAGNAAIKARALSRPSPSGTRLGATARRIARTVSPRRSTSTISYRSPAEKTTCPSRLTSQDGRDSNGALLIPTTFRPPLSLTL